MVQASFEILVVAKAYPVIDQESFTEAVCVAGVTLSTPASWVRLFPLDFRGLDLDKKFPKYSVIRFSATKARRDPRPESYTPNLSSLVVDKHVGTDNASWGRRLSILEPVGSESMCGLQRSVAEGGATLGFFPVKEVLGIKVEDQTADFKSTQIAFQDQMSLLGGGVADGDRARLEPVPFKFKYHYICHDPECRTHTQTIVDWELGALYRRIATRDRDEIVRHVRKKFLDEICGPDREVSFVVGTMLKHPRSFIVLGVVYPMKDRVERSATLFQ